MSKMSGELQGPDRTVFGHLQPMFPQLSNAVIETSILHPSNRQQPFDEVMLLQRCLDDLLELRTFGSVVDQPPVGPHETGTVHKADKEELVVVLGTDNPVADVVLVDDEKSDDGRLLLAGTTVVIDLSRGQLTGSGSASRPLSVDEENSDSNQDVFGINEDSLTFDSSNSNGSEELPQMNFMQDIPTSDNLMSAVATAPCLATACNSSVPTASALNPPIMTYTRNPSDGQSAVNTVHKANTNKTIAAQPGNLLILSNHPQPSIPNVTSTMQTSNGDIIKNPAVNSKHLEFTADQPIFNHPEIRERVRIPSKRKTLMDDDEIPSLNNNKAKKRCKSCERILNHGVCNCMLSMPFVSTDVRARNASGATTTATLSHPGGAPPMPMERVHAAAGSLYGPGMPSIDVGLQYLQTAMPGPWRTQSFPKTAPLKRNLSEPWFHTATSCTSTPVPMPQAPPAVPESTSQTTKSKPSPSLNVQDQAHYMPLNVQEQAHYMPLNVQEQAHYMPLNVQERVSDIPPAIPKPVQKAAPTAEEILDERCGRICVMFELADPVFVKEQLKQTTHNDPESAVCNYLLENPGYPKHQVTKRSVTPVAASLSMPITSPEQCCPDADAASKPSPSTNDYYKIHENSTIQYGTYYNQSINLLKNEFRKISMNDLRAVAKWFNNYYAPTRKFLLEAMKTNGFWMRERTCSVRSSTGDSHEVAFSVINFDVLSKKITLNHNMYGAKEVQLLKCGRNKIAILMDMCKELLAETQFILLHARNELQENDEKVALALNQNEYEEEGQAIECGCCFGDFPFDSMVQCYEGHLFCQTCLQCYGKEAVFGQGKCSLTCMTDGCDARFPKSQLERALPSSVIAKYEERQQEEAINLADMEDLVRCPHCEFAALLDQNDKVFKCQNTTCLKETCRYCKEDWEEHFGKRCSELEKQDETKLRIQFEERMTTAKIRTCGKCKASFTKTDGCNKMTCRCGAKMCYICRAPVKDYSHFCNHPRDPGKGCTKCKACSLWTNPEEDDERAVREIKKEAAVAQRDKGFDDSRQIGAPDEPNKKSGKT